MIFLAGDQEDEVLLNKIVKDSKQFGGYDVIIDDGGHTSRQMLTSIKVCLTCRQRQASRRLQTPYSLQLHHYTPTISNFRSGWT